MNHRPDHLKFVTEITEQKLAATKSVLHNAIRHLETSALEHRAISEAFLANEKLHETNRQLQHSQEDLQSLISELTALNQDLQDALKRERTTSLDLRQVVHGADIAMMLLDKEGRIRFFSPAAGALLGISAKDLTRPISELAPRVTSALLGNIPLGAPLPKTEVEIQTADGHWCLRGIHPSHTRTGSYNGAVITFVNITDHKRAAERSEKTRQEAQLASVAKSRFLATASHDLRQPLQTLFLVQGMLAQCIEGQRAQGLLHQLEETLTSMAAMLNAVLDINQIEAGHIQPSIVSFAANDVLEPLKQEFTYLAEARGLSLRVVSCRSRIESDPALLTQILRNLIANALKYTKRGKVLVGCRHVGKHLRLQVWDTGIGIPADELNIIFEAYHQIDIDAVTTDGIGLGLAIVRQMAELLNHTVRVQSREHQGSIFTVEVPLSTSPPQRLAPRPNPFASRDKTKPLILVIEDEPDERELLRTALVSEGYSVTTAASKAAALDLVSNHGVKPDIILADYNLRSEVNGLDVSMALRKRLGDNVPVIMLTGDITHETARKLAEYDCLHLKKPRKTGELTRAIHQFSTRHVGKPPR